MKAAIYARYSSHEQDGNESIDSQLACCREFIQKQGWTVPETNIFIDKARSGTTTRNRSEFKRMMELSALRDPPFDVVVVLSTSRFSRDIDEAAAFKAILRQNNIDIRSVTEPLPDLTGDDISALMGRFSERTLEFFAHLQSLQTGKYAFEGQRQVTSKGFHGGGKAPYGYHRVEVKDPAGKTDKKGNVVKRVTFGVTPHEADMVRRIYEMFAGGASYKRIAVTFNEEGETSPGGGTWDISAIRTILLNEAYLGRRVWNKTRRNKRVRRGTITPKPREEWEVKDDAHEAIVDKQLWDIVQAKMANAKARVNAGKGSHWTRRSPHLLTGLIRCGVCRANYHMNTIKSKKQLRQYYRCGYHSKRGNAVCANGRTMEKKMLENAVLELFSSTLLTTDNVEHLRIAANRHLETLQDPGESMAIENKMRRIDREMGNLTRAIKEGGPLESLVAELKASEESRSTLTRQQESMAQIRRVPEMKAHEVREALSKLRECLESGEIEKRKALLKSAIEEIRIPEKGPALLETNPTGLLASLGICEFLVTPRGVPRKETLAFPGKNPPSVRLSGIR